MGFCEHFDLMARYNRRMNRQLLRAAESLPVDALGRDLGAFFHSITGTFNHILVGDLVWLSRFASHRERYESLREVSRYPKPAALNQILYEDLASLREARTGVDEIIARWTSREVEEGDFAAALSYANTKGIPSVRVFGELVSHFFNHQTHHRGQLTTLFSQQGVDVGVTDFLVDIPNQA